MKLKTLMIFLPNFLLSTLILLGISFSICQLLDLNIIFVGYILIGCIITFVVLCLFFNWIEKFNDKNMALACLDELIKTTKEMFQISLKNKNIKNK